MKRNGFTLIELLAVIVILAIIALIATPIILGIINDAREKANERSVELYAAAVKNGIAAYQLTETTAPKSFADLDIQYDGKVECATKILYEDGSFYIAGCTVNGTEVEYTYGTKNKVCKISDEDGNGKYSIGDIISCKFSNSTEKFYVMENEENDETPKTIDMLSMYNLYVGNILIQDNINFKETTTPIDNPTGIQDEKAIAFVPDFLYEDGKVINYYGVVGFSTTEYWASTLENPLDSEYVYSDDADIISPYINSYELYLQNNGVSSASAALISKEQLTKLGYSNGFFVSSTPSWVYSTSYWTGVCSNEGQIKVIEGGTSGYEYSAFDSNYYGVRPVITISTTELAE